MTDFTLDFPPSLIARIRGMHVDIHQLNNYFQVMHRLHKETRIQSMQTLVELCSHKADAQFSESIRQHVEKFKVSTELEVSEYLEFCKDNFRQLRSTAQSEIDVLGQLERVRDILKSIKNDDLLPCVTYSVTLGRKLEQHEDEAKAISMDVEKMMRTFEHTIEGQGKQFSEIKERIELASFEMRRISDEYKQKMNQRVSTEVEAFEQTLENIDLGRYTKDRILLEISDETMSICSEIIESCKETTDNEMNLRGAIDAFVPCADEAVDAERELHDWVAKRTDYYTEEIKRRISGFAYSIGIFFADGSKNVEAAIDHCEKQLEQHFAEDKYLTRLGQEITEVQNSWESDIENFKLIYIDGALESVKNKLVNTFEIRLTEDAANVLQHAQHFLAELMEMVQTWNQVQAERRLRQTEQIQEMNTFLRVLHGKTSDMMTKRLEQAATIGQMVSEKLNAKFAAIARLMPSAEVRKELSRKLDKANCDAAFTVICPAERYEENEFIDVGNMPRARLASEPINAPSFQRSQGRGSKAIDVHKVPPAVVQEDPFCKTEPLMSTLAFGQSRYNDSVKRMLQREDPPKLELQRVPQVLERETTTLYESEPAESLELSTATPGQLEIHETEFPTLLSTVNEAVVEEQDNAEGLMRASSLPSGTQRHYVKIVAKQFPNRVVSPRKRKQFRRFKLPVQSEDEQQRAQSQGYSRSGLRPYDPPLNRWGNRGLWKLGERAEVDLAAYIAEYERQLK